ncbi:MAG: STAS/SEC14 domain-containing protein [Desulfarculus sp.]|nr:STAS/SEC14 domain-containing protein [Pseudomonadota bacterium]MBV1718140.1 STAS/SEC14 domain-containing protein [Desulfarculus sp.]MBU4574091.1 STAS/SEC14 domain-containing protein [Pseudomonadota bacterium]MBU4598634.1 STAS/SEC14 domain-containing protein [Pseudomonadota bacterium]MBV1738748.1 STAS/SEC14 domain-containing protein [Desulfarculus sp.]
MLELMPQSTEAAVAVQARGKLTDTDYQQVLIPRLREMIAKQGKARFMLVMGPEFRGWEAKGAWDDAAFGFKHRKDFAKLALVGAPKWVKWSMDVSQHLMSGEVKNFSPEQEDQAWEWVTA